MKAIILFACAVAISSTAIAQDPVHQTNMKEGLMKLEGRMWYIKAFTDSMKLDNDMVVYPSGKYRTTDGKTFMLKDADGLTLKAPWKTWTRKLMKPCGMIVMKNGFVWIWTLLEKPMHMKNGDYIMPDGTLRLHAGKYVKMKDKTFVDFDGNVSSQQW